MRTFPTPAAPAYDSPADIYAAVYEYISEYGLPKMADAPATGRIFRGYSNRMALPADNEYAVMTIIGHERRGTNTETFNAEKAAADKDGDAVLSELVECEVQIDFYSEPHRGGDYARLRAQAIEAISRSPWGVQFFQSRGISCLYSERARDLSVVTDSAQYVSRWSTVLHLAFRANIKAGLPWFETVGWRIENVDVHHPPQD